MGQKVVEWCRATSFGLPVGPWRFGRRVARQDLIDQGLGSYDEYGCFYTTVPGGMDVRREWMEYGEAQSLALSVQRRHAAENLKRSAVTDDNRRVNRVRRSRNKPGGVTLELFEGSLAVNNHDV